MIVAFDGICLGDGPITGVGRAFLNGLTAYARAGYADCILLVPPNVAAPSIPGVRCELAPRGAIRRQLRLPSLLQRLRADVLHSSVASIPRWTRCRTFATVHDLPWMHPEVGEPVHSFRHFMLSRLLRHATAIITPSLLTAMDTRAWLGRRTPPLAVIPHGTALGPAPTAASTAARHGPLLVLGDDRPRKNRDRVREAHALARQQCPTLPDLRFLGPPHDYVDEPEKERLLRSCRAVVHCSLFEGFGMPVLEGMAQGAPVLCSDLAPHQEITNGAALFADPRNSHDIAHGLCTIHTDEALRWRLAQAGHQRAAQKTCEAVAAEWSAGHRGEWS